MVTEEPLITNTLDEVSACASDGVGALHPVGWRGVAGESQRLAYCCLVAAAAHVSSTNGDHRSDWDTFEGWKMSKRRLLNANPSVIYI